MKMKKYIFITVLAVLTVIFFSSCRARLKVVPEVSAALMEETLLDIRENEEVVDTVIENKSELLFFTVKGKIFRLNLEKKFLDFLYDLTVPIDPHITHRGNTVIFKKKDTHGFIIFDLEQMKVVKTLEIPDTEKIISLDDEQQVIGYQSGAKLFFFHYPSGKTLADAEIENPTAARFFNSDHLHLDGRPKTVLLSSTYFYIFDRSGYTIEKIKLEHPAASGFLADAGAAYYGSQKRELVKFVLDAKKESWKFKIAEQLRIKPVKAGPYIVITPEDNNIYFFNKRGTLYWWERLNSTRKHPPTVMRENVAVFVWDKSIKFFDYKKKLVRTYPFARYAFSKPVCRDEYLYLITEAETDETAKPANTDDTGDSGITRPPITLDSRDTEAKKFVPKAFTRIGNNYGVAIKTDPQYIMPMGKSITFKLRKFNLLEPELDVSILNPEGEPVFQKRILHKQDPTFVWVPGEAVDFKMVIEINALNKKGLRMEQTFHVLDTEKILKQYYYSLQKYSTENRVIWQ
ncbi:MAG: hypothetical protein GY950_10350 [bacterium]|nr:hypothetical protein [bacterium]